MLLWLKQDTLGSVVREVIREASDQHGTFGFVRDSCPTCEDINAKDNR
jgi:hypothetical protein